MNQQDSLYQSYTITIPIYDFEVWNGSTIKPSRSVTGSISSVAFSIMVSSSSISLTWPRVRRWFSGNIICYLWIFIVKHPVNYHIGYHIYYLCICVWMLMDLGWYLCIFVWMLMDVDGCWMFGQFPVPSFWMQKPRWESSISPEDSRMRPSDVSRAGAGKYLIISSLSSPIMPDQMTLWNLGAISIIIIPIPRIPRIPDSAWDFWSKPSLAVFQRALYGPPLITKRLSTTAISRYLAPKSIFQDLQRSSKIFQDLPMENGQHPQDLITALKACTSGKMRTNLVQRVNVNHDSEDFRFPFEACFRSALRNNIMNRSHQVIYAIF